MVDYHHQIEVEVEVPRYFLCPISLEIMKDPVTLSTGITYDRDSIENWLFSRKKDVCPVTKQVVRDIDITPNHTLRRLIQSWCTLNTSSGVERFPTPRPAVSRTEIVKLLKDSLKDSKTPHKPTTSLKRLKSIVLENEKNKRLVESVGAADYMSKIIISYYSTGKLSKIYTNNVDSDMTLSSSASEVTPAEEALSILYHLRLSPAECLTTLFKTGDLVDALTLMMQRAASYESRTYAVMLLKSMFEVADPMQVTSLNPKFFTELVHILADQISQKATKATLKLLISVCPWGRNRIKAVNAGVVPVLIDTLLDSTDRKVSEMIMMVLLQTCQSADGRAEVLKHGGGLAVVSKMVFGESPVAGERAVRVLHSVAMCSGNARVLQEMVEVGAIEKLMLVLQVDCGRKMKEKAREILKMHSRVSNKSPCIDFDHLML